MTAPQAAGVIHSDFEKGFIRAETVSSLYFFYQLSDSNILHETYWGTWALRVDSLFHENLSLFENATILLGNSKL